MLINRFVGFAMAFAMIFHSWGGLKEQHWAKLI
jgi:hypothetical protein